MDTLPVREGEAREKALRRGGEKSRRQSTGNLREEVVYSWGKFGTAIERQEATFGRPAPSPVQPSKTTGKPQLAEKFVEFMMGLPSGWITDVPDITRAEAIRACGNGVVPQQGATALTWLIDQAHK